MLRTGDCETLQAAVDTLVHTPPPRLRTHLTRVAASRRLPTWTESLAGGDGDALQRLGDALRTYHLETLAPFWQRIHAHGDADRVIRLHRLLRGGTDGLLSGLGPRFRWRQPVLEADYPVNHAVDWARPTPTARTDDVPLGPLLGHTRAAVLGATPTGASTVELARMQAVTHPAISQHLKVLRAAGLVITVRKAGRSFHVATAEGRALLRSGERGEIP
ncbi:ArsR family transcriptional regulator [Streptomyces sp. N2-109]|uniref:ArsR family transcriptional regulator n=1 Tax=Streptomyces gossypii TaxID=2883101 RepID=A0ABT2K044_9ACTN|nr:helix-turn-helix domain-containing protein [Streptomyces gossypii]MCT2593336.1 ArsR family transcriptional regulator [Streptomyces gossypii]